MSKNPIARLRQDLEETVSTRRAETYDMINVRPGSKIAAMIELLAELRGVPVSSMLTDDLSERLASYAASDRRHASVVLDAAEAFVAEHGTPSPDSALGRLVAQGLLKVETDNPYSRQMPNFRFAASGKKAAGSPTQKDDT
jgi:hypothetical protein